MRVNEAGFAPRLPKRGNDLCSTVGLIWKR